MNTEKFSDAQAFPSSTLGAHSIKVAERRAFVDWISTPKAEREPRTLKAWADANGVRPETVQRWKRDTRVYEEAADRLGRHIDIEMIPGAIAALGEAASDVKNPRHVQAAKTLIDYLKWHVQRTSDDATDVSKLTDAELRDLMIDALDELDVRTPLPELEPTKKGKD